MKSVGIDIDGVLADFVSAMVDVIRYKMGITSLPENYRPSDWSWLSSNISAGTMKEAWRIIDQTEDFWMKLQPIYPNIENMKKFFLKHADKDFDIYFITARNEGAGRSVKTQSESWLRYHLNDPDAVVTVLPTNSGMHKVDILYALDIDFSIDDHSPTVTNAKSTIKKHKAYLLDQPWNQDGKFYGVNTVKSLQDFFDIIEAA